MKEFLEIFGEFRGQLLFSPRHLRFQDAQDMHKVSLSDSSGSGGHTSLLYRLLQNREDSKSAIPLPRSSSSTAGSLVRRKQKKKAKKSLCSFPPKNFIPCADFAAAQLTADKLWTVELECVCGEKMNRNGKEKFFEI